MMTRHYYIIVIKEDVTGNYCHRKCYICFKCYYGNEMRSYVKSLAHQALPSSSHHGWYWIRHVTDAL